MRADLLSLTLQDLGRLSTVGQVKGAQKDLAEKDVTRTISEADDGTVTVVWSDGIVSTLPPKTRLLDCHCTCENIAPDKVCRHLIRAVLAYQQWAAQQPHMPPPADEPWNPGEIPDSVLVGLYDKSRWQSIQKEFARGHVFELVCGTKPLAYIHTLGITTRFLVAHDLNYIRCDCHEAQPCSHIALAVWAFRQLAGDAGLVETQREPALTALPLLDEVALALRDMLELGFGGATPMMIQRIQQLARRCQELGLMWLSVILDEVSEEHRRYTENDARFSAAHTAALAGELLIRSRAIQVNTLAVPLIFVKGSAHNKETLLRKSRFIGLGCGVEFAKHSTRLNVYLQNEDTGQIVAVQHENIPKDNEAAPPLHKVASARVFEGTTDQLSLSKLSTLKLVVEGGRLSASGALLVSGAKANPVAQTYDWENLHAPLLAENFAEVRARQSARPPASLRPRRAGEDVFVCPIASIERLLFDTYQQSVKAVLVDNTGAKALLVHPYTTRGGEGVERLLWHLKERQPRFIFGQARPGGIVQPISLVFEHENTRYLVQPYVDTHDEASTPVVASTALPDSHSDDPVQYYPARVMGLLGELMLQGLQRANMRVAEQWRLLAYEGHTLGFVHFARPVQELATTLDRKAHQRDWDWQEAADAVLDLLALTRLAQDMN